MDDRLRALRATCTDTILGNGLGRPRDVLASIDPDAEPDTYGDGGVVTRLEQHVATLLGKPAAVFLPSGTMAQAATLRVHADRRGSRTVVWHPFCHLERHESQAYQRLHQLVGRPTGDADRLLELGDLTKVAEPVAALLLELPQRDLGGQLPSWEDLTAQTEWARARGAAVHLDGARLWEATAGYDRGPAEIAALFDTVYVSFYKGIGALPGCCVAGSEEDIAQVREWRSRLGGTLFALWPAASSALTLLGPALAEMPARMAHARAIATALQAIPEVRVVPDPPQTPMMHLLFSASADTFRANSRRLAEETGLWLWPSPFSTGDPAVVRAELTVGSATLRHKPEAVAEILGSLCT
ncbi:low specificity L-threonine aldolase [Actinoplanes sp. N902-109]|uniref:threonine aldolase family protein n=1 Tax=Actinoplanes sp. (strain N902-109) TaxID=649831 RepID=UPI0003293822|nr:beta-eliminating lyase-related protein [Actinoplanes sp. N902-109]AGL20803.1 aromatic amino acid beta-eliminating lyase/threonine aldolase [Actinoplanes sp. N902-109]